MSLDADAFLQRLRRMPPAPRLWIAFSGGLDSSVLLHLAHEVRDRLPPLAAIHVHHGLVPAADQWVEHCERACHLLDIPLTIERVNAAPEHGESPEAAARKARHAAFRRLLGEGEGLLTAHHQDDQAETLLLALLRGSGPAGLAAMPDWRPFGRGWLGRPLLPWSRQTLRDTAERFGLSWIEDPSNDDERLDRNFLRHRILPLLTERWPAAGERLAHAARLQAEGLALHHALAIEDQARVTGSEPGTLSASALGTLPAPRQRNLLRWWLNEKGLPLPGRHRLEAIRGMLHARPDAEPRVTWPGAEVRRFRDDLHAFEPLPEFDPAVRHPWPPGSDPVNPATGEALRWSVLIRQWPELEQAADGLAFGFRQGGERLRPRPGRPRRPLKDLMREAGIPPWMRNRIPLVYRHGRLLGVYGLWRDHEPE